MVPDALHPLLEHHDLDAGTAIVKVVHVLLLRGVVEGLRVDHERRPADDLHREVRAGIAAVVQAERPARRHKLEPSTPPVAA